MEEQQIRVLANFVLVRDIMTVKSSLISLDAARSDEDKFDHVYEVLQLGRKCEEDIKVGDRPIFNKHMSPQSVKVLEKIYDKKTVVKMVVIIIVYEGDIIAIDNSQPVIDNNKPAEIIKMN